MTIKVVALLRALPELARDDFLYYWQNEHPALVWQLPGLRAYRQSPAIQHRKSWPYDGMAELWFDSVTDVRDAFNAPEAEPLREHEAKFLDQTEWFIATTVDTSPGEQKSRSD